MKPTELRELLLSSRDFEDLFARVPDDAKVLVITSLAALGEEANKSAEDGRVFRRTLLVVAALLTLLLDRKGEFPLTLFVVLAGYEFAYGNAAKVRADLLDAQSRERYRLRVDEYLRKKFPEYTPPRDDITVFHVSPHPPSA